MNLGIICEFNPFHQGHQYLIDSVKHDGDSVICVMSGNFVQRGEPAVYDKFTRTKTALANGADLVIEIPTACATLSAKGFAEAGVTLLESTGICDQLVFGAECDDVEALRALAEDIKAQDDTIKAALAKGISYPKARQEAVDSPLLESPNNILAIEYLSCTHLPAQAVKRIGKGHDSDDALYSASAIRETLPTNTIASLKNCEKAVLYKLRSMSAEDFAAINDVSEGLENRIVDAVRHGDSLEALYDGIKTKRYTHARIRRIILRAYLSLDKNTPAQPLYLRVLGFNARGREMLSEMKKAASLPIITRYSDAKALGGEVLAAFEEECRLTDIYQLAYKTPLPCGEEQKSSVIIY